jgi:hypothetical protein
MLLLTIPRLHKRGATGSEGRSLPYSGPTVPKKALDAAPAFHVGTIVTGLGKYSRDIVSIVEGSGGELPYSPLRVSIIDRASVESRLR